METTVTYGEITLGGKVYQKKVTKQVGLQEIMLDGEPTLVEAVTIIEYPGNEKKMGSSLVCTVARPQKTPEEEAAFLAHVREVATQALISQGIW